MKKMKKAEATFLMKSIYLILVIIIILIVINQTFSMSQINAEEQRKLEMKKIANDILEILIASPSCIAYKEVAEVNNKPVKLLTHRVVDVSKLESFANTYADVEPDCARNYEYRFSVEVEKFNISKIIESSENWHFGVKTHSLGDALKATVSVSTPITIRINDVKNQPGLITVTLYSGDLERLTGIIDRVCTTNTEIYAEVSLSYPTYADATQNSLCMSYHQNNFCLKLACNRQIEFPNIDAGSYKIKVAPIGNMIEVEI